MGPHEKSAFIFFFAILFAWISSLSYLESGSSDDFILVSPFDPLYLPLTPNLTLAGVCVAAVYDGLEIC